MARRSSKGYRKQKVTALIISIVSYVLIVLAIYSALIVIGIMEMQAIVESLVLSSAVATMVILYLFGRIWKKELG